MSVALRVSEHRVQTASWVFCRLDTGRTVTLVGTMHIGDAGYFDRLSALLDGLAGSGAEVHVEGIAHRSEEGLSALERRRLATAGAWANRESSGAAVTALEAQSQSSLRLPEGTRNIDLSHVELLRRIGWKEYRRLFRPPPTGTPQLSGAAAKAAIRFQLRHNRGLEMLRALSLRQRRLNRVVLAERNAVAFAGAVDALQEHDVALVWGCDHLPGLARLFARAGYRLTEQRWFDACSV
jgi:uncharacterized protein YbaP (TraB family)